MEQSEIDYQHVMDLGFERGEMSCAVHEKQYGYPDFWVEKKLSRRVFASWDNKTRHAKVCRTDKGGWITHTQPVRDLRHLKEILDLFGKGGAQ